MASLIIFGITALLAVATLAPFVPIAHGAVRICDFPRLQIASAAVALAIVTVVVLPGGLPMALLLAMQTIVAVTQAVVCLRFTPLWRVQSLQLEGEPADTSLIRIFVSNVKMSNRKYDRLVDLIQQHDPHIAAFLETDDRWLSALAPLKDRMPHTIEYPQDNSYGLVLFSRLPLQQYEIRFLVSEEIPSVKVAIDLPNGGQFRLFVVHPEPPVPFEDTLGRDGELVLLARDVKADSLPAIVTGDLNDVAWSRTTRRFQRLSGLLDPRVGRGFFNSFDARYPFLRWPLDHLFHHPRFRLVRLERLPHIGSDHFPMLFELALTDVPASDETPPNPDSGDVEEAHDVARAATGRDRRPVGTDWE